MSCFASSVYPRWHKEWASRSSLQVDSSEWSGTPCAKIKMGQLVHPRTSACDKDNRKEIKACFCLTQVECQGKVTSKLSITDIPKISFFLIRMTLYHSSALKLSFPSLAFARVGCVCGFGWENIKVFNHLKIEQRQRPAYICPCPRVQSVLSQGTRGGTFAEAKHVWVWSVYGWMNLGSSMYMSLGSMKVERRHIEI